MKTICLPMLMFTALLAGATWAQTTAPAKPLNLSLPPNLKLPASSSSAAQPASSGTAAKPADSAKVAGSGKSASSAPAIASAAGPAPGVYYGDHSNQTSNAFDAQTPPCDDATYNNAQVHGSLNTGVVSGSHIGTGTYEGGTVNIVKATGSCEHPTGGIGISIGVEQGQMHGRRGGWGY